MDRCIFCQKDIGLEKFRGDAYHVTDGEFACHEDHYDKWVKRMMGIIEHDDWMEDRHWN